MQNVVIGLIVPRGYVKTVKLSLEAAQLNNSDAKIRPLKEDDTRNACCIIPTCIPAKSSVEAGIADTCDIESRNKVFNALAAHGAQQALKDVVLTQLNLAEHPAQHPKDISGYRNALAKAIERISSTSDDIAIPSASELLFCLPHSYSIYTPLLLLPQKLLEQPPWKTLLGVLEESFDARREFFKTLSLELRATHVAIDAPIPAKSSPKVPGTTSSVDNIVRSPYNIKPIWGDFGPVLPHFPHYKPNSKDFEEAFWVSTCQNGIFQCWAPLYTMFSSGNITEKARILRLDSVRSAIQIGEDDGSGCCAVDLFAGIGYFAFSYAKAGVSKVLCWDINPWSIEGLRRGSLKNKWTVKIMENPDNTNIASFSQREKKTNIVVFPESNFHAATRVRELRHLLPPIRHVNCGMLPSADSAWQTAIEAVDGLLGGWIHMHETAFQYNIDGHAMDVLRRIQGHLDILHDVESKATACLESIVKVKSVGPKLLHIVLDIWIPPKGSNS